MKRRSLLFILFPLSMVLNGLSVTEPGGDAYPVNNLTEQDTIDSQILYSGRAWMNLYSRVVGDQFLFSGDFMPGTITTYGRTYTGLLLRYDIYNDELLLVNNSDLIIERNRETTDWFTLTVNGSELRFRRIDADSVNSLSGYVNVLVDDEVSLYVRYRKEIVLMAVDEKFDQFRQTHRVYLERDGRIYLINGNRDLMKILGDKKKELRTFVRNGRLEISRKLPQSYVPVVEHYLDLIKTETR